MIVNVDMFEIVALSITGWLMLRWWLEDLKFISLRQANINAGIVLAYAAAVYMVIKLLTDGGN